MIGLIKAIFGGRFVIVRLLIFLSAVGLSAVGIACIYAAANPLPQAGESLSADDVAALAEATEIAGYWKKQAVYLVIGLLAFAAVSLIDYRQIGPASYWFYGVILFFLSLLILDIYIDLPLIRPIKGSRRWIDFGIIPFQPSEFCKIAYILALSWYLRYRSSYRRLTGLIGPFALTVLAIFLILKEPDLGTTLLLMPILFVTLYAAGAQVKHLLLIIGLAVLVSPLLWFMLHDYQRMRISTVLLQNPKMLAAAQEHPKLAEILVGDPTKLKNWKRNEGYHLMHSIQAISSGGLSGYGFRQGPYSRYNYLPERHNDFIFAMVAHQWGFWGGLGVLGLYAVILICAVELAVFSTDPFVRLVIVGIATMILIQVIVNVSMTLGLMPITGLTLPFVSYGGSSLLVGFIALGLVNNLGRHRPVNLAGKPFEKF